MFSLVIFFFLLVSCDLPSCLIIHLILWWSNVMLGSYSDPVPYPLVYPLALTCFMGQLHSSQAHFWLHVGGSVTFCGLLSSLMTMFCCILSPRFLEGKLVKSLYNNDLVKGVSFFFLFFFYFFSPSPPREINK